jgi:hypothetical protein
MRLLTARSAVGSHIAKALIAPPMVALSAISKSRSSFFITCSLYSAS